MIQRPVTSVIWHHFRRCERGSSLVEAALILPLLIGLYMGALEVSNLMTAERKLDRAVATIGDLVARESRHTKDELADIAAAAEAFVGALDATGLKTEILGVARDDRDGYIVDWSYATDDNATPPGSAFAVDPEAGIESDFVVIAGVSFEYRSAVTSTVREGMMLPPALTFSESMVFSPREGGRVDLVEK